jgi:hypothetical protein
MTNQGPSLAYYAACMGSEAWYSSSEHSPKERRKFTDANDLFMGCVISVLTDHLDDVYMHITDAKELWNALVAKYDSTMLAVICIPWRAFMTSG